MMAHMARKERNTRPSIKFFYTDSFADLLRIMGLLQPLHPKVINKAGFFLYRYCLDKHVMFSFSTDLKHSRML